MEKIVEVQVRCNLDGSLTIDREILQDLKINAGENVYLTYLAESEGVGNKFKRFLLTEKKIDEMDEVEIVDDTIVFDIPVEFLERAGIDENADLDIACFDKEIRIKEKVIIPEEVYELCEELGISRKKVEIILNERGAENE